MVAFLFINGALEDALLFAPMLQSACQTVFNALRGNGCAARTVAPVARRLTESAADHPG
jgi:hypothetical protein